MKVVAALLLGLVCAAGVEGCGPVFRYRYAGPSKTDQCLTTTDKGLVTRKCDDSNHSQMMVLQATNVPNTFFTGSHTSDEFIVKMERNYMNTFTLEYEGRCIGAKGALVACPLTVEKKGKGKAAKKAKTAIKKASWYIEPLLSQPFDTADAHAGHDHSASGSHDGHDHSEDSHDGHDHSGGDHSQMATFSNYANSLTGLRLAAPSKPASASESSWSSWGSMDSHASHDHSGGSHDGHDHSDGSMDSHAGHDHSGDSHDGHDHGGSSKPRCYFSNGKYVCV